MWAKGRGNTFQIPALKTSWRDGLLLPPLCLLAAVPVEAGSKLQCAWLPHEARAPQQSRSLRRKPTRGTDCKRKTCKPLSTFSRSLSGLRWWEACPPLPEPWHFSLFSTQNSDLWPHYYF